MDAGTGILRLVPTWVPRAFCTPGRRLRLHPDDYYPLGKERGGIDERWLSSAIRADNGPLTDALEGLSLVVAPDGECVRLDELVAHLTSSAIGRHFDEHGGWPMYAKFFDNHYALPFHFHQADQHAAVVGKRGKAEAYYFPPQMNNHLGASPVSFLGLHPEVTPRQVREKLRGFLEGGDNRITELSKGYRMTPGTGWDIPVGVLHAPASLCTYEPQSASDVLVMAESWSNEREVPVDLMWKDVPADRVGDLDYLVEILDWQTNTDPQFWSRRFTPPVETAASRAAGNGQYVERWVSYRSDAFSAKELTVRPGAEAVIADRDAYGLFAVEGWGEINGQPLEALTSIRYGQLSYDEYFVTAAALAGEVRIRNLSECSDLVVLKHFGPGNRELANDAGVWREAPVTPGS